MHAQVQPLRLCFAAALGNDQVEANFSLLLVAAASIGNFKPYVLQQYIKRIEVDFLKIERIAAKSGIGSDTSQLPEGINPLRRAKLITRGLSKAAL